MKLDSLLLSLAQVLGMSSLALNEHGVASLQFDDQFEVHIEPEPEGGSFHLYSPLCRIPSEAAARLALYEALLSANCFGHGTAGAAFSLDESSAQVLLGRRFDGESTTAEQLADALRDQLSVLDIWMKRLPDILDGSLEAPAGTPLEANTELHFMRA